MDFYLVILVNSGAKGDEYRHRRAKIRETWANRKTCEYSNVMNNPNLKDKVWILVFVLGKAGGEDDKKNIEEAKAHNDILIGDINDNYWNNMVKLYMGQLWASLLGTRYTLKTDDDVYVRIPNVINYLVSQGSPPRFYGGGTYHKAHVIRYGKWKVSEEDFPEKIWPPFNAGAFILFSADLLDILMSYIYIRKPLHTDDAYIGVAMRDFKVKVVHILSFVIETNMATLIRTKDNCYMLNVLAYGHSVDIEAMEHCHKRLEELCHSNTTLKTLKC
ncbi:beta-1,3-galactosyltransferase 1-like [Dendronephthya gigantea]|uniref:beta-1,3-galactosyltransferase 1-like n=1 Tax=Dendronephthya gigantea TaxID=151771 RepID=UPI00106A6ED6|nr:beta-1,3-galactosyltransferase 1-like [Dendronephthya gigantea]XP_028405400.1 beta-1,3-galactosyltransferase 1-like [Dendronephthya gigantea]